MTDDIPLASGQEDAQGLPGGAVWRRGPRILGAMDETKLLVLLLLLLSRDTKFRREDRKFRR